MVEAWQGSSGGISLSPVGGNCRSPERNGTNVPAGARAVASFNGHRTFSIAGHVSWGSSQAMREVIVGGEAVANKVDLACEEAWCDGRGEAGQCEVPRWLCSKNPLTLLPLSSLLTLLEGSQRWRTTVPNMLLCDMLLNVHTLTT